MVAALGLFIGFITLVIRQILILAMVLLAPLAILAWIFPGNDAPWKLWRLTFTKLLLMFPLIMVLIGAGRIAATIIPSQQGSNGLFTQLLVIIAYVLPYFFIPLTFKFAGSFFANIAGFVNDRSKGFFDKQREHRAKERKELKDFAGQNLRFNPNNRFTSKFNTAASWTAAPLDNLAYKYNRTPGLSGRGSKIKASIDAAAMDQTGKLYQELQNAHSFNDAAGRALSGVHDGFSEETIERLKKAGLYNKVPKTLEEMDTFAGILEKSSQETERFAANPLRTVGGRIASLYRDPEMTKANAAAAGMMLASAHGFASSEDLATMHERLVEGGMNSDLAQNMVSRAQVLGQHSRPDIKSTYGVVYDSNGKATSGVVDKAEREATMYERDADGNIVTETFSDGTVAKVRDKKAYKKWSATKRSRALASTIKQSDWMPAKSGAIKEMYGTIKEIANKTETKEDGSVVLTAEAKAMREQVALGASQFSSSDTGAKVIWKELVDDLDLGPQLAQLEAQQAAMQERTAGTAGAGGDGHDGGADAGGAAE